MARTLVLATVFAAVASLWSFDGALAASPSRERVDDMVYDRATRAILVASEGRVFRSSDHGASWSIGFTEPAARIGSIALAGDGTIYAAGGTQLLRSEDGMNFTAIESNLSGEFVALAAHTTQSTTLYAVVGDKGIFRSKDAGTTWTLMDVGPPRIGQLIHTDMAGSMETGWLYAVAADGLRFSMDCFCLWRAVEAVGSTVEAIAAQPGMPDRLVAASSAGLLETVDGGRSWHSLRSPESEVTAIAITNDGEILAGGIDGRLFSSKDAGMSWSPLE